MKRSKISFKNSILKLNLSLICIMSLFMVMYYVLSHSTTNKYNDAIQLYDDINGFYDYVSQANFSLCVCASGDGCLPGVHVVKS